MNFFEVLSAFGATLAPLIGLATLYINRKYDANEAARTQQIADLNARLDACEKRHRDNDAKRDADAAVQSVDSAGKK